MGHLIPNHFLQVGEEGERAKTRMRLHGRIVMLLRMAMLLSYGATTAEWHRLSETRTAARRMTAAISPDERRGGGRAPPTTAILPSVAQQQQTVVEVATQAELIAAIGSNVTISLTGNIILSDSTYIASSDTGIVILT